MTKMKVLHVISSLDERHGGPTVALKNLALAQLAVGLDVRIVMSWGRGEDPTVAEQLRGRGVKVVGIGPCFGRLMWSPRTGEVVRAQVGEADVVHIHGIWEDICHQAAVAAVAAGKPYVSRPCGMLVPWSLSQVRWLKRAMLAWRVRADLNQASAIHYTTGLERSESAPVGLRSPSIVEGNGVDWALFENLPKRGSLRHSLPAVGKSFFLLFLGRVTRKKGLDLIVQALARPECAGFHLAVVGPEEGAYRREIEALAAWLGVSARVHFLGKMRGARVAEALVDADLTVLPSLQENFATSILESLAAGTPVIVSDRVNLHPDITRHSLGAVVRRDSAELARVLGHWSAMPKDREAAGKRARAFARERSWEQIAKNWARHYSELLNRKSSKVAA